MRRDWYCRWLALGIALSGCAEPESISGPDGLLESSLAGAASPSLAMIVGAPSVRVQIDMDMGPDLLARERITFDVGSLEDGVSLRVVDAPSSMDLVPLSSTIDRREPIATGSLTMSGGAQFFDEAGRRVIIDPEQTGRLLEDVGLTRTPPAPRSGETRQSVSGPRGSSLVTPASGARALAALRGFAREEPAGRGLRRFHAWIGEAEHTLLFDDSIGAVVRRSVRRNGEPTLHVADEYGPGEGGHVLVRSVSEWVDASGAVQRRSTKTFSSR